MAIKPFTKAQQRIIAAVPTSWLDDLLTGKDGLGSPPWDCRDIEKLLRGVQDRVKAAVVDRRQPRTATTSRKRSTR